MTRKMSKTQLVSYLAIATGLIASQAPAADKGFLGVGSVTSGDAFISESTDTTDILVNSSTAVIDWTPDDNATGTGTAINFLDSTGTVNFQGFDDYAVLNRINVADANRQILLNGHINSLIGENPGGNIFFYSPSGFVVGSNAVINVGSLVLTASPIGIADFDDGGSLTFGAANPTASITTNAGSQITANGAGNYVALVAPQITHRGTIRTDTTAALVAAEAATITFSPDGLFTIQVDTGTDAATGIHVDGGTIARNSAAEANGNVHRAYLVSVAKNDAVTMLIDNGGSIGFDTATSAAVGEDNVVVLAGGRHVSGGQPSTATGVAPVNLQINGATFTTDVVADISGGATINTDNGNTSFGLNSASTSLDLTAGADSIITATNGNTLSIAGSLRADLDILVGTGPLTEGHELRLTANGSSALTVGGDVQVSAQAYGTDDGEGIDAGDAIGGTVIIQTGSGSTIDILGDVGINVDGHGGNVFFSPVAGDGTGGIAQIVANGGAGNGLTINGQVNISASGTGGTVGGDCIANCGVTGGNGNGGNILIQASTVSGSQLSLGGTGSPVNLTATGEGGPGDVAGGSATGGNISLVSADAGAIAIAGNLNANASAQGGFGMESSFDGGQGGSATGGNVIIAFGGTASSIDLNGSFNLFNAGASGGNGWGSGGNATGGHVNLQASSNGLLTANFLGASANAFGGTADVFGIGNGAVGGSATGGRAWVQATGGGDIEVNDLSISASGTGGDSNSGAGGAGRGGYAVASAAGAATTLTVTGFTDLEAIGQGGATFAEASIGGVGRGGQADIFADDAGVVTLTGTALGGSASMDVSGFGGGYFSEGSQGGAGLGGFGGAGVGGIFFQASDGATLTATNSVDLAANGTGGFSLDECFFCGGTGGNGTGGAVTIQAFNFDPLDVVVSTLTVGGSLEATANGRGSSGLAGPAGNAQGGTVTLAILNGAVVDFAGLSLAATGTGGWQFDGGQGGNGTGGLIDAFIGASGGTLTVDGFTDFDASGFGGNTEGGTGGDGLGGTARYLGLGGVANFNGDLIVQATGNGGSAGIEVPNGTGGDGTGNIARISAAGGDINIGGTASVSASGFGGRGTTGGSGAGGGNFFTNTGGAHIVAQNGDIDIGGAAIAMSDGFGGDGADGGNGGDGTGGWASIHAANGNGGPSSITVQEVESSASASANGIGGDGGDGVAGSDGPGGATGGNGGTGGAGGNGGVGTGGVAAITASAGNGTLNIGIGFVDANGTGGAGGVGGIGGAGGFGSNGIGGNGGAGGVGGIGGAAFGGLASAGVENGTAAAAGLNLGTANFGGVEVTASALGGDGGTGGSGGSGGVGTPNGADGANGNGGAGGNADGGIAELQARGGTVNLFSAVLTSEASGGNGGGGTAAGAGGDAESDEAYILVTNRVGNGALRGSLNAVSITAVVTSTGGAGSTPGVGLMEGGSGLYVFNGDADLGSVDFTITADEQIADLATDSVVLINADVAVDSFTLTTDGEASIYANDTTPITPSLSAGTFSVTASNFVHDERPFPDTVGVIGADTFNLTTDQDLIIDAHLVSTSSLNLIAPGLIDIEDATTGGNLTLQAGSTIAGGSQLADGFVSASATGNITLGNVVSGTSFIDIFSSDGDLSLGFLSAATTIDLEAAGNIGFGDVTADDFDFDAGGDVNGGDILAGTQASGEAGGSVNLGAIDVGITQGGGAAEDGFAVGIVSATSITVGDVDADEAIGFATLGDLTTGNLNAGTDVLTLIGGDTSIASITAGDRTYHGDAQMFLDAGGPDNFDPGLVFAQAPVQSSGGYTVAGAIQTGTLQVGAAAIAAGDITAFNSASLDAAGSVTTGNIDTGLLDIVAGTDITAGNIFAFDGVTMDAGGSILTGDIDAGSIDLLAGADITTGYLNTRLIAQLGDFTTLLFPGASITLESGGDISTGDISSIDGVYLNAVGSILTGDIAAFDFVEAHAGTSLATDDIDAGDYVLLDAGTGLSAGAVSGSDISATAGGTATIGGAWSAGNVQVTSNDIDITADGSISAGDIALISTNATQTVVGDGVAGGGYQLSDAEYDRLHANDINVIADSGLGAAPLMLIGDLSVDGSDGEAIHDYEFITGDSETESAGGSIRVVGEAVFSNMGTTQSVGFTTGTFELDAATGLLSLENAPGTLGGELFLNAAHIHVASGDILDQLAEDPQYAGYQEDLNAPAAVQRPEGVIRANVVEIEFGDAGEGELNTLYVQNTGTSETPAGFVIGGASLFGEGNEVTPPPGSIDLVINGQILTEAGTLTGIDVRDALVEAEGDITPFTANSTINGCLLTGSCQRQGPFPPGFNPTPGIQDEIELIDRDQLPPPLFDNEDFIDDNIETTAEGATSPIKPPHPLFDTSELGGKGDVDDPVSGSGNPALMENGPGANAACRADGSPATCKEGTQQ